MNPLKPITIVGGGLAGLSLGIGLRRRQVPVTIWEAGRYPRHRVCGEFISGRGQDVLQRLNLSELLLEGGASLAQTARFFLGRSATPAHALHPPALCLSRFVLDRLLSDCFQAEGGELRQNARWQGSLDTEGVVRASGRRAQPLDHGWRWFGLKVHARQVHLDADLEMHASGHAYIGLCRLPGGDTNVCGLFRARPGSAPVAAMDLLRGAPGTKLHERMAEAIVDPGSFCSVAGLFLAPQRACAHSDCRIGDALTMIPPVTGNGMSMAFEAAEIALAPILSYARGEMSWSTAGQTIAKSCDAAFRGRLRWARVLHTAMFWPAARTPLGWLLLSSGNAWQLLFARTR